MNIPSPRSHRRKSESFHVFPHVLPGRKTRFRQQTPLTPTGRQSVPIVGKELIDRTPHRNDVVCVFNFGCRDFLGRSVADTDALLLHHFDNLVVDALGGIDTPWSRSPYLFLGFPVHVLQRPWESDSDRRCRHRQRQVSYPNVAGVAARIQCLNRLSPCLAGQSVEALPVTAMPEPPVSERPFLSVRRASALQRLREPVHTLLEGPAPAGG